MSTKLKTKQNSLAKLVKNNSNFTFIQNGKIKCLITGHELMPTIPDFKAYLQGKAYKRALQNAYDISAYSKYLVDNTKDPRFLFCKLTGSKVLKKKSVIDKHIAGKKFQKKCNVYHQQDQQQSNQQEEDQVKQSGKQTKEIVENDEPKRIKKIRKVKVNQ